MTAKLFHVTGIQWDTDGDDPHDLGLSASAYVFTDDEEGIADALSDEYGYCIQSFGNIRECDSGDGVLIFG